MYSALLAIAIAIAITAHSAGCNRPPGVFPGEVPANVSRDPTGKPPVQKPE